MKLITYKQYAKNFTKVKDIVKTRKLTTEDTEETENKPLKTLKTLNGIINHGDN